MTFWHQPNGYKGSGYLVQKFRPKLLRKGERGRGSKHYLTCSILRKRLKTLPYTLIFQHLSLILKICLKFTTALLSAKMGVFRTKFVTENVEQCGETEEREGEAQNTTLHAKFSKICDD